MKSIIVIAGPTAVGKTAHAIQVARYFDTVILSADSRQCYKEMCIGVARPSAQELDQVPHYFIASHSIYDQIDAAWYEEYALGLLQELFADRDVVVVTGGTGLYLKALTEGLDPIPAVDVRHRQFVMEQYETSGMRWLQQELERRDPLFTSEGEMQNPQRMMRALEVVLATGQSILSFRGRPKKPRPFQIIELGLELPRPVLYERIMTRVDLMMQSGLEAEAQQLFVHRHLNALQTVGYQELFGYFEGRLTLEMAVDQIKQNTRRYAKRQLTWFKRQAAMHWIDLELQQDLVPSILSLLDRSRFT